MASHVMTPADRMSLHAAARDLHTEFRGIFGEETIESLLLDSYAELASQRHRAPAVWRSAQSDSHGSGFRPSPMRRPLRAARLPAVLFLCVHNAGRSQMALGWFTHLAGDRAVAWSGGSRARLGSRPRGDRGDGRGRHRHLA